MKTTPGGTYLLVGKPHDLQSFRSITTGLNLVPQAPGEGERGIEYAETWTDSLLTITWIEKSRLDAFFVWVHGQGMEKILELLKKNLRAYSVGDLHNFIGHASTGEEDFVSYLFWIAFMTPQADARTLALFDAAIADPRPNVRRAAMNAYMIHRWPQWRDRAEELARLEASDERLPDGVPLLKR